MDSESGKTTPVVSAMSDGPHVSIVPKPAKTKRKPEAASTTPTSSTTSVAPAVISVEKVAAATVIAAPVVASSTPTTLSSGDLAAQIVDDLNGE